MTPPAIEPRSCKPHKYVENLFYLDLYNDDKPSTKVFDKISKYKDFEIEIENIRHSQTTAVPVIMESQRIMKKGDR